MTVHASCYGVTVLPPDLSVWACDICQAGMTGVVSIAMLARTRIIAKSLKIGGHAQRYVHSLQMCCLCPMRGGALKRTSDSQWVHVLCALLVGARFKDPVNKEPINVLGVHIPTGVQCCYCGQSTGTFLKCHDKQCNALFHLTCTLLTGASIAKSTTQRNRLEVCTSKTAL